MSLSKPAAHTCCDASLLFRFRFHPYHKANIATHCRHYLVSVAIFPVGGGYWTVLLFRGLLVNHASGNKTTDHQWRSCYQHSCWHRRSAISNHHSFLSTSLLQIQAISSSLTKACRSFRVRDNRSISSLDSFTRFLGNELWQGITSNTKGGSYYISKSEYASEQSSCDLSECSRI